MFSWIVLAVIQVGCGQSESPHANRTTPASHQYCDSINIADAELVWSDSSSSRLDLYNFESEGRRIFQITEQRYHRVSDSMLIRERVSWIEGAEEDNHSWLTAEAMTLDMVSSISKLWTISEKADRGEEWFGFYRTTEDGCCDRTSLYRLHRLIDGKMLFAYNFGMTGGHDRFAAVLCDVPEELQSADDTLPMAIVYYANDSNLLHSIKIRMQKESALTEYYYWPDAISLVKTDSILQRVRAHPDSVRCTLADPAQTPPNSHYSLVIGTYGEAPVFVVPIRDDDFLLQKTKFEDCEIIRTN
ncbi:MAG: hypothetical protein IPH75_01135 [bacterium]|nr:hypothetical protein [bacterium]